VSALYYGNVESEPIPAAKNSPFTARRVIFGIFGILLIFFILGLGAWYGWKFAEPLLPYLNPPSTVASVVSKQSTSSTTDLALSTTTPIRALNQLTIPEAVPTSGKFIAVDLVGMKLSLYQDGAEIAEYPILTKGKPGTPYETPSGIYSILSKEKNHVNGWEKVSMPYSMEFYGNYFIHGWPTYANGTPVASTYSGGCIRLSTEDAAKVFEFADKGTNIFVYDTGSAQATTPAFLGSNPIPVISADSYLVADIDTGDVYAERGGQLQKPIASVTKLMTALTANETIMFDRPITVSRGKLSDVENTADTLPETFVVGDLLYPLLMESNNHIADTLAQHYGTSAFVNWMNGQAKAIGMASTTFADASGASAENISTREDLYRLAVYLANKKSFIWNITRTPQKTIVARDGSRYAFTNFNIFSNEPTFTGGKVGHTTPAQDTMVSVFSIPMNDQTRRIAVIVLHSDDYAADTQKLTEWFSVAAANPITTAACATCSLPHYRKIQM
jgi:D-alanyl-D-alanine endopeptidase (penicillin-binding protein 7)